MNRLLTYDPEQRMSAAEALAHPYFSEFPYPAAPGSMPSAAELLRRAGKGGGGHLRPHSPSARARLVRVRRRACSCARGGGMLRAAATCIDGARARTQEVEDFAPSHARREAGGGGGAGGDGGDGGVDDAGADAELRELAPGGVSEPAAAVGGDAKRPHLM